MLLLVQPKSREACGGGATVLVVGGFGRPITGEKVDDDDKGGVDEVVRLE